MPVTEASPALATAQFQVVAAAAVVSRQYIGPAPGSLDAAAAAAAAALLNGSDPSAAGCTWCALGQQQPLQHVVVGGPPGLSPAVSRRRWKQGAGVVAVRNNRGDVEVLVVNGRRGGLGFPKGGRKGSETALENALREWREETGLPDRYLGIYQGTVLVDGAYGCHYFVAEWRLEQKLDDPIAWAPGNEDPSDPNPVVRAQWLPVGVAVKHIELSQPRKALLAGALHVVAAAAAPAVGVAGLPAHALL